MSIIKMRLDFTCSIYNYSIAAEVTPEHAWKTTIAGLTEMPYKPISTCQARRFWALLSNALAQTPRLL